MSEDRIPNAFLIGVQKAGTTTLYDWLSQHPEIYGLNEFKDVDFFADPERSKKSKELLQKAFKDHNNEPVILQSFVNYLLYENALSEMYKLCPNARLIVILRNPVDRAFSAYHHFKKFNKEIKNIENALLYIPKDNIEFSIKNNDFTYIEHGFYYKQLKKLFQIFSPEKVLILEFDDLKKQPNILLKKVYDFLEISDSFYPTLIAKNVTGQIKNQWIQKTLTTSGTLRKMLIKYTIGLLLSDGKRRLIRYKLIEYNTKKKQSLDKTFTEEETKIRLALTKIFLPDVMKLDELLGTQFKTKWFGDLQVLQNNAHT